MGLANDKQFQMRVSDDFLLALDEWRRHQSDIPARAEAVRRLIELGLRAGRDETDARQGAPREKGEFWAILRAKIKEWSEENVGDGDEEVDPEWPKAVQTLVAASDSDLEDLLRKVIVGKIDDDIGGARKAARTRDVNAARRKAGRKAERQQ